MDEEMAHRHRTDKGHRQTRSRTIVATNVCELCMEVGQREREIMNLYLIGERESSTKRM